MNTNPDHPTDMSGADMSAPDKSIGFSFPFGALRVVSNVQTAINVMADKFRYYPTVEANSDVTTLRILHARHSRNQFDRILAQPSHRAPTGNGDFFHITTEDNAEYLWWPPNMMVEFAPEEGCCGRMVVAHDSGVEGDGEKADRLRFKSTGDEFDWELVADIAAGVFAKHCGRALLHTGMFYWKGANVMIGGESGAGKTTACLAMLRAGARYAADDLCALGLDPSGQGVLCAGLLTPPNIVGQAPATLAELETTLGNDARWKSRGHAALENAMEAQPMADTTPAMLVILERTAQRPRESRFRILDESQALEQVMELLIDPSNVSRREFHLDMAIALLDKAVVARATLSADIGSLPEFFDTMLQEARL